jgi:hypothetical protein
MPPFLPPLLVPPFLRPFQIALGIAVGWMLRGRHERDTPPAAAAPRKLPDGD